MVNDNNKTEKFLVEYKELCLKYHVMISACGCCNSPYLFTKDDLVKYGAKELTWKNFVDDGAEHLQKTK